MSSRVPDALMYAKGQDSLNQARNKMIKNQEQALTSKRVNRPSDDPAASIQILQVRAVQDRDDTVSSNLEVANSILSLTDASLGELTEVLSRSKELAVQMGNTTNQTEDARESVLREVEQLAMRAVQVGNTRMGDRYIFGGYQMDRAPFDLEGNYFGDNGTVELEMDRGQRLKINVPGLTPFFGVEEMPNEAQQKRFDPKLNSEPSVEGALRDPASIKAKNLGVDPLEEPERYAEIKAKTGINVFASFKEFIEGLQTGNKELLNNSINNFEDGFKQVLASRASVGARQSVLRLSLQSLDAAKVTNAELKSRAEDADTLQVYSDLAKNENVLKSSLEINKKLLTPSLLDFLK
jgi:flagellar hook-associated protein 3 FlgL